MTISAQVHAKLRNLVESGGLPASQCGQAFRKYVSPLLDTDVLSWKRSGAGSRLVVNDADALRDFLRHRFPETNLPQDAGSRVVGVGRFRDTKTVRNDSSEIIALRVWRNDALLKNGKPVGAAKATATHGMFSFPLTHNCSYELRGQCALVENPAVFAAFEKLHLNVGAVIYGHGRISNRMIDWLAHTPDADFCLFHLPDYDPVGLSEFQRLRSRLCKRVILHLPSDLDKRFARFSKRKLLANRSSQATLAKLRTLDIPEIRRVVELIDRNNAGLEQEALLLGPLT
jgi:hypothetical protein